MMNLGEGGGRGLPQSLWILPIIVQLRPTQTTHIRIVKLVYLH
jgi:hypothetical protein